MRNCSKHLKMILLQLALVLYLVTSLQYPIYTSSCATESASRVCAQKNNLTEYILSLKKGGTNILSTSDYDKNFFLCEQYTFDCGYVEDENQTVSISNGIQLRMSNAQVDAILPTSPTLSARIKPFLNMSASSAEEVFKAFPLVMTATETDLFFTNFMSILLTEIKSKYASEKLSTSKVWTEVNVNIRTAVSEVIKEDKTLLSGPFWDDFKANNFTEMASYLKDKFRETDKLFYQRSAYLIDSVSKRCNKYQSVNFLVDESGSIGAGPFRMALDFLLKYIDRTYDDPALMSVHFYDSEFDPYLHYGNNKTQLLNAVNIKHYRSAGTLTGKSINATIAKIQAGNFQKGLNKVMVVMTDGFSFDDVLIPSSEARSKGITMIAVGIGSGANDAQLLKIAQTPSNVIKVSSYDDLDKLVNFIQNFFCKQIIDIELNEKITGNVVRTPDSPSYFRMQRSPTTQVYELKIKFDKEPELSNTTVQISQFDPFPDEFSFYRFGKRYKTSPYDISYFIYPAQQSELRVKKKLFTVQNFEYAYLAMAGVDIRFNLSLSKCSTMDCSAERTTYDSIETPIPDPTANSTSDDMDISNSVYTTSCPVESLTRVCPQKGNLTEYLLTLKKGSSDILSLADYDKNFFVCEEYAFDCGYVENQNETISIANGIELRMDAAQVDTILPSNSTLATKVKTYLGLNAQDAKCGMKIYPLVLTAAESDLFFTNYMDLLATQIKTKYLAEKLHTSLPWTDLNINIKTAVSQVIKQDHSMMSNDFWASFSTNDWAAMSSFLKKQYQYSNEKIYCLRSAYLIDAVTQKCDKFQSINFLIDQSGSIGSANFNLALTFLEQFINVTNDDPKMMSVHFYDAAFQPYLNYGNSKDQLITGLKSKTYRAGGTYTGRALKSSVDKILTSSLGVGVNKILIVVTDGQSYDQVVTSAKYAVDNKITVIAVGVGPGVNDTQMLQIGQSASNVIKVSSFVELTKLAKYMGNFLCKQVIDLKFNTTSTGHSVKVPSSPTFFKVEKIFSQTYELTIKYDKKPEESNVAVYTSDYDPFPNEFSEYSLSEGPKVSETERSYYITPVRMSETRKKKSYFKLYNFTDSYIAVAGSNISFSLFLGECKSAGCANPPAVSSPVKAFKAVTFSEKNSPKTQNIDVEQKPEQQKYSQTREVISAETIAIVAIISTFSLILLLLLAIGYTKYFGTKEKHVSAQRQQKTTNFDGQITEQQVEENQKEFQMKVQDEIDMSN